MLCVTYAILYVYIDEIKPNLMMRIQFISTQINNFDKFILVLYTNNLLAINIDKNVRKLESKIKNCKF